MSIKSFAAKIFAKTIHSKTQNWASNPVETQQKVFLDLMQQASETEFGKDHNFSQIKSHQDFVKNVPVIE